MSKGTNYLRAIACGKVSGILSLCSSNEYVVKAALEYGKKHDCFILIEATANQVNQYGGYTGMKPQDFRDFVFKLADGVGFDTEKLILGGDHLGPLFVQDKDAETAMKEAETAIELFVRAGFEKIHIDTSMRLASDSKEERLSDEIIAARGATLCKVAEAAFEDEFNRASDLVYVIGSEVPIPGGVQGDHEGVVVTSKQDFETTVNVFKDTFDDFGLNHAFERVIAVVVQPGVEFGDDSVDEYDRKNAEALTSALEAHETIVFEGHSTDYQRQEKLKEMVEDGIAILKVGPELTFELREGLFSLQHICNASNEGHDFIKDLDLVMCQNPKYWEKYYTGDATEVVLKRKYSYSDRWRYYFNHEEIQTSIKELIKRFDSKQIPLTLIKQFMPNQYEKIRRKELDVSAVNLMMDKVHDVLDKYYSALKAKKI